MERVMAILERRFGHPDFWSLPKVGRFSKQTVYQNVGQELMEVCAMDFWRWYCQRTHRDPLEYHAPLDEYLSSLNDGTTRT